MADGNTCGRQAFRSGALRQGWPAKALGDEALQTVFGDVGGSHGTTSAQIVDSAAGNWHLWSNRNRVAVHHDRIRPWIPALIKFMEIQPDRVGNQITHLILPLPGHGDARQIRHIRPISTGP